MAIILKNAPKTEEGRKLQLTKEQEEKYKLVCRINEEKEELEIVDLWNPEEKYDNEFVIVPLTSTYAGCVFMSAGTEVRNVIGSTPDPKRNGYSWIQLINAVYSDNHINEDTSICCLDSYIYDPLTHYAKLLPNHINPYRIVGGHMVLNVNGANQNVSRGASFYLLHICNAHNSTACDSYYFKVARGTYALVMQGFLQAQLISKSVIMSQSIHAKTDEDIVIDVKEFCKKHNIKIDTMYF